MQAGRLDRYIVIQSATAVPDATGQPINTWATFASVWAERKDVRGNERFTADQKLATRTATYRIRWITGINEQMRISDGGSTYYITGIADNERQGWMELSVESTNPANVTA
jgi:SPP1 family predicted phage head-tail adaptor